VVLPYLERAPDNVIKPRLDYMTQANLAFFNEILDTFQLIGCRIIIIYSFAYFATVIKF